jgi:hypothetical protein
VKVLHYCWLNQVLVIACDESTKAVVLGEIIINIPCSARGTIVSKSDGKKMAI